MKVQELHHHPAAASAPAAAPLPEPTSVASRPGRSVPHTVHSCTCGGFSRVHTAQSHIASASAGAAIASSESSAGGTSASACISSMKLTSGASSVTTSTSGSTAVATIGGVAVGGSGGDGTHTGVIASTCPTNHSTNSLSAMPNTWYFKQSPRQSQEACWKDFEMKVLKLAPAMYREENKAEVVR